MIPSSKTVSLSELQEYCRTFLDSCGERTLVLLNGPLGVGKTQFVKTCAQLLGSTSVDSPTFSVINHYNAQKNIFHVDLYRLETPSDIDSTGFWELFELEKGLIFIEWAERIKTEDIPLYWPQKNVTIGFTTDPEQRNIIA